MKSYPLSFILILLLLISACKTSSSDQEPDFIDEGDDMVYIFPENFFVGTYTRDEGWVNGTADGIYRGVITDDGEKLSLDTTAAEVINPSFVAVSPDKKNLYAVSELGRGNEPTGYVHAFSINEDLSLTYIDKYPTNAQAPAHISIDDAGKLVFAANYQGGVVMAYKRMADGSLEILQQLDQSGSGPHPNQNGSHTHMAKLSPAQYYLYITDLGSDKVWSYHIDHETLTLTKTDQEFAALPPGSGPRHMDFGTSAEFAYVMNELNSTITVFDFNFEDGSLSPVQTISTLPESFNEWNSTADIHVHPSGKFLYGSNRGHNSIVSYAINQEDGTLTLLDHISTEGEFPRNFAVHPSGDFLYVANQNSDNITVFSIDAETGVLTYTGESIDVNTPVCIAFY